MEENKIPVWEKFNLTIEEASQYFSIGRNKLYELTSEDSCPYVLRVGNKKLIKRVLFEQYLENTYVV